MKFISKSSNLLVVLRPGLAAQPLTGTPAKATVSVRFKDGVAEVSQEELVEMMLAHPGFNQDFISAETVVGDPYAAARQPSEPAHVITEVQFGTPMSRQVKGGKAPSLPPEMQQAVQTLAAELAKQMLPDMVKQTLQGLVEAHKSEGKPAAKAKGKPGPKPKAKAAPVATEPQVSTQNPATQESVS